MLAASIAALHILQHINARLHPTVAATSMYVDPRVCNLLTVPTQAIPHTNNAAAETQQKCTTGLTTCNSPSFNALHNHTTRQPICMP